MKTNLFPRKEVATIILLKLSPWLFLTLILVISIIRSSIAERIDPLDDSINVSREVVSHVEVYDSTHNGFRVAYATVENVTKERLTEMRSGLSITNSFKALQNDAPLYFKGDLLNTDIYDFADFAVKYDRDPAIRIRNIFVAGRDKSRRYAQHNPKIEGYASWINFSTEQGVQYLSEDDVYYRRKKESRIYRYWKCFGLHATSSTDEQFSHFSETERLW